MSKCAHGDDCPFCDDERPAASPVERHRWQLAPGTWAEVTITGKAGAPEMARLKEYVALIEPVRPPAPGAR